MNLDLRYLGPSEVRESPKGSEVRFSPNLSRQKVYLDAGLEHPVRFREAMSALHEIVVGDLRFGMKDRSAHDAWKKEQAQLAAEVRQRAYQAEKAKGVPAVTEKPPPNLQADFREQHRIYWRARVQWANELSRHDPELFRHLVPCDPVVTVAPDAVLFECFSKDESSYGCLTLDRDALTGHEAQLGTTNVDYSLALFEHFQTLRSYRPTRLSVDPLGFEVKVETRADYREEKIDLPSSWLRGFGQLQAAMTLPSRRVELSVDVVYSILAYLKNHREKTGPRSLRFQLAPGKKPKVVIDPWGVTLESRGPVYAGTSHALASPSASPAIAAFEVSPSSSGPYRSAPRLAPEVSGEPEEIKVWGRRRLSALARILPLADRVEVRLLGSGLPSIWIAHLGEMRLCLGLSGWTANDWTSSVGLELLGGAVRPDERATRRVNEALFERQRAGLEELADKAGAGRRETLASLGDLARHGQALYDFAADCYRYREVMPVALSEAVLGPEHPELAAGRALAAEGKVKILRREALDGGRRLFVFTAGGEQETEAVLDADGAFKSARCHCKFFRQNRLRGGPCRHLIALRFVEATPPARAGVPPRKARSAPRREEVVSLTRELAERLRARATAEDRSLSELVEEAWDDAFPTLEAELLWKGALALADARLPAAISAIAHRSVGAPEQESLLLPDDTSNEIALLAQRFGASPSAVVNLACLVARKGRA